MNIESDEINMAVILAAGKGRRLYPFTNQQPKCLVQINGKPLLHYMIETLSEYDFKKIIIVTGYLSSQVEDFLSDNSFDLNIQTVHNQNFASTNNIYSLWVASSLIKQSFVLIECDLIFEKEILKKFKRPNRIALDRYNPDLHNGTTASICDHGYLRELHFNKQKCEKTSQFKTVNITSFCYETWVKVRKEIQAYVQKKELNSYYEEAIQKLIHQNEISLEMVDFKNSWWDEIDTPEDLNRVNTSIEKAGYYFHEAV